MTSLNADDGVTDNIGNPDSAAVATTSSEVGSDHIAAKDKAETLRSVEDIAQKAVTLAEPTVDPWNDNCFAAASCAVFIFAMYFLTLYPDLSGGDSGELTAAAYGFGLGHPPGYPLYCLTGKLFTWLIPFGSVAYRLNLGTAWIGSLASYFLFLGTARFARNDCAGLVAAGLYSLCPLVWSFHIQGEVFALNNMFSCLLVYLTVKYFDTLDTTHARWGAFVMGLGLTNQHTLIVFEGPLMVSVVATGWRKLFGFELLRLAALFFLGFSLYLYMPLSTLNSPYVAWSDSTTLFGFWRHITRVEYGSFRLYANADEHGKLYENLKFWSIDVLREAPLYSFALAPIGIVSSIGRALLGKSKHRCVELAVAFAWLFYMFGFHSLANFPLEGRPDNVEIIMRFWMQPNTIFCLYIAEGLRIVATALSAPFSGKAATVSRSGGVLMLAAAVALVAAQTALWYNWVDQTGNMAAAEFGRALLEPLPSNALFLMMTDLATNSIRYVQTCENYRTDVYAIDQNILSSEWFTERHAHNFPGVVFPDRKYWPGDEDGFDIRELYDVNFGKYRIFTFAGVKDTSWQDSGYRMVPFGYAMEVLRVPRPIANAWDSDDSEWIRQAYDHLPSVPQAMTMDIRKYPPGSWEYKPKEDFFAVMDRYGNHAMSLYASDKPAAIELCIFIFTRAVSQRPEEHHYQGFYKNLGAVCFHGLEFFDRAAMTQCFHENWGFYLQLVDDGIYERNGTPADRLEEIRKDCDQLRLILAHHPLPT